MSVKEHYDNHLGDFYSWMIGDFETKEKEFARFLEAHAIVPAANKAALDLGAGNGVQSVALARRGFRVKAVDFNRQLLAELAANSRDLPVEIVEGDLRAVEKFAADKPELIVCWGDTITHLASAAEIEKLIADCAEMLDAGGKFVLSFRDYSVPLTGDARFIPVRADETRILTCCLDYEAEKVRVTDLLYEKTADGWAQKVSSYDKVRVAGAQLEAMIAKSGLRIAFSGDVVARLRAIIAEKN